jgi:hypothetical protein
VESLPEELDYNSQINLAVNFLNVNEAVKPSEFAQSISSLIASANVGVPEPRKVDVSSLTLIVASVYNRNYGSSQEHKNIKAFKELNEFLSVAMNGKDFKINKNNAKYLPLGHPLSTKNLEVPFEESSRASINWMSSDPQLPEEIQSLVASALNTERGSVERAYVANRVISLKSKYNPVYLIENLI